MHVDVPEPTMAHSKSENTFIPTVLNGASMEYRHSLLGAWGIIRNNDNATVNLLEDAPKDLKKAWGHVDSLNKSS
jgi:hypothetical protein